ncbi:26454_t:CDS:2, partial [Gigaspora margarita]
LVSETINDVRKAGFDFTNIDIDSSFSLLDTPVESIEALNKNMNEKNESDPDDDRICKIQQGIDIVKEKLKEYNNFKILFKNFCIIEIEEIKDKNTKTPISTKQNRL